MSDEQRGGPLVCDSIPVKNGHNTNKIIVKEVRAKMEDFWKEHSQNASEEEMMLDSNADALGREEIPEILSMLPNVKGKDVLELGAGIGRFTGHLAKKAKSVIAIDFMENFVRRNEANNGHFKNVKFLQADVTYLEYLPESFDLVFSNWLLMYLEENEVEILFRRVFDWLRPGGFFYFRESCFHQSGNKSRESNPSQYRKPSTYNNILRRISLEGNEFSWKLVMSKSIQSYIKMKNNRNQICWLVQKVVSRDLEDNRGCRMFGEHFENSFTPLDAIGSIEKYLGGGHVSSGEKMIFEKIVHHMKPEAASHVLNIGCGLGWMAFKLAQEYEIKVHGIDPSANMVAICLERANLLKQNKIQFQMEDLSHVVLPNIEFDLALCYTSADIVDHLAFFQKVKSSMVVGGRFVVVDYCIGDKDIVTSLSQHIKKCDYHVLTQHNYKQILLDAGFEVEQEEDLSEVKLEALNRDLFGLQVNDLISQILKESMLKKMRWIKERQLNVVCFVCRMMP